MPVFLQAVARFLPRHHRGSRTEFALHRQEVINRHRLKTEVECPEDLRKQELRRVLEDGSADVVVSLLFDPRAGYRLVADEILDRMPWYRRRNRRHWLCKILERASEAIDPSTYTAWLGHGIEEILKQSGLPRFAVKVISKSAAFGAGKFVSSTTQLENVKLGLLLIIPLICPNFSKCPAQAAPCKALLTPGVEDLLRSAASGQQA